MWMLTVLLTFRKYMLPASLDSRVNVHVYILGAGLTHLRNHESRRDRTKTDYAGEGQQQFTRNRPHGVKSGGW
jgi:hypothetical protein